MKLPIDDIRTDGGTQPRASLDVEVIAEYAEAMKRGDDFPPVKVMHDGGDNYWLYDGFHRVRAAEKIGREEIEADVEQGTREDAQWASLAANKKHGLRRSKKDTRRAVKRAIKMRGEQCSDQEIANHVGVSRSTAYRRRRELEEDPSCSVNKIDEREVTRDGTTYKQDTSNIGESSGSEDGPEAAEEESEMLPEGGTESRSYTPEEGKGRGDGRTGNGVPSTPSSDSSGSEQGDEEESHRIDPEPLDLSQDPTDELPTREEVVEDIIGDVSKMIESDGADSLRKFIEEQEKFTQYHRKRIKDTAEDIWQRVHSLITDIEV